MSKAKTASKNNPKSRSKAKEFFYNEKKIKPVKIIFGTRSFIGAEYDGGSDLVTDSSGNPLPWKAVV